MKKRTVVLVAAALLIGGAGGWFLGAQTGEATGNYSNEMKMEYRTDYADGGANTVERNGDHEDTPYFYHVDFYNAKTGDGLYILPQFKTIQQTSWWSCGVSCTEMVLDYFGVRGDWTEEKLAALKAKFVAALDNDINTSLAVTAIYDVLKSDANATTKRAALADFDTVLCLDLLKAADAFAKEEAEKAAAAANTVRVYSDDPEIRAIEEAIDARAAAKKAKNYAEADRIRAELLAKGIVLTDTANGTTFERK